MSEIPLLLRPGQTLLKCPATGLTLATLLHVTDGALGCFLSASKPQINLLHRTASGHRRGWDSQLVGSLAELHLQIKNLSHLRVV